MMIWIKRLVLLGLSLALLAVFAFTFQFRKALFIDPKTPQEVLAILEPHMQLIMPTGEGPHPLVLSFHGCGGIQDHALPRAQKLVDEGYAVMLVDSFSGRGLEVPPVCAGTEFQGPERAGDVFVALDHARNNPDIDPNRLFIQGFSHGAWTILEAMAITDGKASGLTEAIPSPLSGVQGAIAWYPYCGFGNQFSTGWRQDMPTLMLLARKDQITAPEPCERAAEVQQTAGGNIEMHLYPEVGHGFDIEADWVVLRDPAVAEQAFATLLDFLARH